MKRSSSWNGGLVTTISMSHRSRRPARKSSFAISGRDGAISLPQTVNPRLTSVSTNWPSPAAGSQAMRMSGRAFHVIVRLLAERIGLLMAIEEANFLRHAL